MSLAEQLKPILNEGRQAHSSDPLAPLRELFHMPLHNGTPVTYLCGNSLGLQPKNTRTLVLQELDTWAERAVEGHFRAQNPWYSYHELATLPLARLAGAQPHEVVAMNSLTVNLHLMLISFYRPTPQRYKILIEAGAFPSDRYAVVSQAKLHGFAPEQAIVELGPRPGEDLIRHEDLEQKIAELGSELALVLLGQVNFLTGQCFRLPDLARKVHEVGACFGVDLAHGMGNLELSLHDWNIDFAVWCSYKYLNGGPGTIGGCFVHQKHGSRSDLPKLAGWWGHNKLERFKMGPQFQPLSGVESWQLSNPPILQLAALRASLEVFGKATIAELQKKRHGMGNFLIKALQTLAPAGLSIITPLEAGSRGAQLSLRFKNHSAKKIQQGLAAQGVLADLREPDVVRVAAVPLYNTYLDCTQFLESLLQLLSPGEGL